MAGLGVCGPSGRFKRSLVKKIAESGQSWDDETVSPIVRQTREYLLRYMSTKRIYLKVLSITKTVQHWGYCLTEVDYDAYL